MLESVKKDYKNVFEKQSSMNLPNVLLDERYKIFILDRKKFILKIFISLRGKKERLQMK